MMSSIEPQRIAVLTEALEKNVFNADFGIQGKKQIEIVVYFHEAVLASFFIDAI